MRASDYKIPSENTTTIHGRKISINQLLNLPVVITAFVRENSKIDFEKHEKLSSTDSNREYFKIEVVILEDGFLPKPDRVCTR